MTVRRLSAVLLVQLLAGAWLVVLAVPAMAACHIAGFVESEAQAEESTGVVSLVVELQGRVGSCAGTVDVTTVDGTATAGEDYEAVSRTLTFEENDDRVETVDITILGDDEEEGDETLTVELSNPTGDISGTSGPATVTIADAGGAAPADATSEEPADGTTAEEAPTAGEEPTADATEDSATEDAAADDEGSGGTLGIVVAVVAALAIGIGAFVALRGRAT